MNVKKLSLLILLIIIAIGLLIFGDLTAFITILKAEVEINLLRTLVLFFITYVVVTLTGLPGAALLSTSSGYLFGFWPGVCISSLAAGSSAVLSFLLSRYLLKEWFNSHFSHLTTLINRDIKKDGLTHLFLLRLIPGIPFPLLNMSYGVTSIPLFSYWWVSQIALLPITLLLVNAGMKLREVSHPTDIFTPKIILSLLVLGLFPITVKWLYKKWSSTTINDHTTR